MSKKPGARDGSRGPKQPPRRSWTLALVKWGFVLGLVGALAAGGVLAVLFWFYSTDPKLPRIHALKDYRPKQVTRILAANGTVVGELFEERRTYVPLSEVSPFMIQAIIDAEDADFRQHAGLDFVGMLRAFVVNLRSGKARQGASTITQQVVRTFLLSPEKVMRRKLQEIILARRLESALSKDEILTLYLNQIYFGHGRYGIEEAARFYFGKRALDLDVAEAATLAGIPQSPERLSPLRHPEAAKQRQIYVLDQLVKNGHLDVAEAQRLGSAPIQLRKDTTPAGDLAPELVEIVRKELVQRYGEDALPTLGLTIKTTIDPSLQAATRAALEAGLRAVDERHGYRGPTARLDPAKVRDRLARMAKDLPANGPHPGTSYDAIVMDVSDASEELLVDLGGWRGAVVLKGKLDERYNPDHVAPHARYAKNDVVRVRPAPELGAPKLPGAEGTLALDLGPQGAVVVMEPATRRVLAMVGGYGYEVGQFNRARRAKRQPGSAFKPIVYAAALDSGAFTPATVVNDAPVVYDLWKPENYQKDSFRGPIRLREALAHSINTVAIWVLNEVGPARVVDLARSLGIEGKLPTELSLALGSGEVTPLELTNAFATFAAGGAFAPTTFLTNVGEEEVARPEPAQVLRPEIAYLVTSMMQSVIEEGTATAARKLHRPLAGKTGTSNKARDAWFVGYSPDRVCGVWVGFDDMRSLGDGEAGGKAALPIWIDVMRSALAGLPARTFRQPPGIVVARIDRKTGVLAALGEAEADTLDEVFLDGTVPTVTAPAPGEVDPSTFVLDQMGGEVEEPAVDPKAERAAPPIPGHR